MDSSDQEVIVDHVGNLSATKESVLFLGFLFLQTDSPFEMGIMDDFCPALKQSSHRELQNSAFKYIVVMMKTSNHPLNQPTPLL